AKKSTPYVDQLSKGATEDMIGALLKKQHQVIIAAIKAGRIEELIRHSLKQERAKSPRTTHSSKEKEAEPQVVVSSDSPAKPPRNVAGGSGARSPGDHPVTNAAGAPPARAARPESTPPTPPRSKSASGSLRRGNTAGLNLDQVISDYLSRSSGQA